MYLNKQYLSPCGHFCKFVKATTKQVQQVHLFLCMICVSSTAVFSLCSLLYRIFRHACNLQITNSAHFLSLDWHGSPTEKNIFTSFCFSGCQLELTSKSWWYCTFRTAVWSGIFCVTLMFACDICVLSLSSWSVELISGVVCAVYQWPCIRWLFSSSASSF